MSLSCTESLFGEKTPSTSRHKLSKKQLAGGRKLVEPQEHFGDPMVAQMTHRNRLSSGGPRHLKGKRERVRLETQMVREKHRGAMEKDEHEIAKRAMDH